MTTVPRIFLIGVCVLFLAEKTMQDPIGLYALASAGNEESEISLVTKSAEQLDDSSRQKRAPQFGSVYDDYSDIGESRHFGFGRKKHRKPYYHGGSYGGCRGYGCSQGHGWRPQQGGWYNHGPQGGQAFASASAGGNNFHNPSGAQASAQSASFSLGPYSATFSNAQASAGSRGRGPLSFLDY